MSPKIMSLCFSAFLLFWVVLGFLFGLGRGAKKSMIRFVTLAIFAVLLFFFTGMIVNAVLEIQVSGNTLNGHFTQFFEDFLNKLGIAQADIISVAKTLAVCAATSIVFAALFFVAKIISWPVYALLAHFFAKRGPTDKKHAWWGALIGVCQGILIAFILLIPVSGYARIAAATVDTGIFQEAGLDESTVGLIDDISHAYNNSVTGKIFGALGADQFMFDLLSTQKDKATGITINASKEINGIVNIATALSDQGILSKILSGGTIEEIYNTLVEVPTEDNPQNYTRAEILITQAGDIIFDSSVMRYALITSTNEAAKWLNEDLGEDDKLAADRTVKSIANWNDEKEIFKDLAAKAIIELYAFYSEIGQDEINFDNINFGEIGGILDDMNSMQLFNGFMKPLLLKGVNLAGFESYDVELGESTISFDIKSMINDMLPTTAFRSVLNPIGSMIKQAMALKDSANIGLGTINDLLDILGSMPNDQAITGPINDAMTAMAKEQLEQIDPDIITEIENELKTAGLIDADTGTFYLDIAGNENAAKLFGGLMNMAEVVGNIDISGENSAGMSEGEIGAIVSNLHNIATILQEDEGSLEELQIIAAVVVNKVADDAGLNLNLQADDIADIFANEADAIGALLQLNNVKNPDNTEATMPDAADVAAALVQSEIIFDLLNNSNVEFDFVDAQFKTDLQDYFTQNPSAEKSADILKMFGITTQPE